MGILQKLKSLINPYAEHRIYSANDCDFFIHVMDFKDLNDLYWKNYPDKKGKYVNGFCLSRSGDIYVAFNYSQKDKQGQYLPMFETLGHELWHKVEWNWHGKK